MWTRVYGGVLDVSMLDEELGEREGLLRERLSG